MEHPTIAPDDWQIRHIVYPGGPGQIAVAIAERDGHQMLAVRWCEGNAQIATWQRGAHDWFVLPRTFGVAISRTLFEMKGAGFQDLDEGGLDQLIRWLGPDEQIHDSLCY